MDVSREGSESPALPDFVPPEYPGEKYPIGDKPVETGENHG